MAASDFVTEEQIDNLVSALASEISDVREGKSWMVLTEGASIPEGTPAETLILRMEAV